MPFDVVCFAKIVSGLAPAALSLGKGETSEALAKALEGALKGGEAIKGLHEPQHKLLSAALQKAQGALQDLYAGSLRHEHSAGYREEVEVAFANFSEVIARCLPTADALARLNHDPDRVAAAVVEAALTIRIDIFANPHGEARRLLTTWIATTYRVLRAEPAFAGAMAGVNWAEVLTRQERIENKLDSGFADSRRDAERRHAEMLEEMRRGFAREEGVDPEVLRPLFDHLGQEGLTRVQLQARAQEAVAAILARAREAPVRTNFGPEIDAIIAAARARLAALDTAGAVSILDGQIAEEEAAFRRRQIPLLREKAAVQRLSYDRAGARATLTRLLALDPDQVWRWIELGDLEVAIGATSAALSAYLAARAAAARAGDARDLSVSHNKIGDMRARQGDLAAALDAYLAGRAIRERLAAADPGDAQAQRDLSVSHNKIGDMRARQGDLAAALDAYLAGLAIAERLAAADPGDAEAQRDLIVSCVKIAETVPDEAEAMLSRAQALLARLRDEGRLEPQDAWMPADIERRLASARGG